MLTYFAALIDHLDEAPEHYCSALAVRQAAPEIAQARVATCRWCISARERCKRCYAHRVDLVYHFPCVGVTTLVWHSPLFVVRAFPEPSSRRLSSAGPSLGIWRTARVRREQSELEAFRALAMRASGDEKLANGGHILEAFMNYLPLLRTFSHGFEY